MAVGEHGLGADMDDALDASLARGGEHVLGALHRDPHVDLDGVVLGAVRRCVKHDVGPVGRSESVRLHDGSAHAGLECRDVVEIAAHRGRAECFDLGGRAVAAGERGDRNAPGSQRRNQTTT